MASLYDLFNDKAEDFARDLVRAYPDINEFRQLKSAITMLRNVDPKKPRTVFEAAVLTKYRTAIVNRDDSALMSNQIENLVEDEQQRNAWLPFVEKIKDMWQHLTDMNRDAVWKHFQVLLAISDKCGTLLSRSSSMGSGNNLMSSASVSSSFSR